MRAFAFALAVLSAESAHAAERCTLDPAHTQVAFSAERFGFNNVLGRFDAVSGEVLLDEAAPANSSVSAQVEIASVSSGNATRDEHLRGERWLNAAAFPAMTYRSTSVRLTGERSAEVTGNLTLMGATHPLTLAVTLNKLDADPATQRPAAGFSATGSLDRARWGIAIAPALIGATIRIQIEALCHREA